MSDYKQIPMDMDDLENWSKLFSMTIGGIEEHLTDDKLDVNYVISSLLSLERHLNYIVEDVGRTYRKLAHENAVREVELREAALWEGGQA